MQLSRLLLLLAALVVPTTLSAPAKTHELVARLPMSASIWNNLHSANLDIFAATAKTVDVRATRQQLDAIVKSNNIDAAAVKIVIADLDQAVAEERLRLKRHAQEGVDQSSVDYHDEYHRYGDMKKFAAKLAQDNPDLATFVPSIGKSVEGRDLFQIKVTAPGDNSSRKRIVLQAMQHAREWVSGATAQYLADHLIQAFKANDERIVKLLNQVEFVITPVCNPDGYEYTWTNDRLWRKNRAAHPVDINRNWPHPSWGKSPGSSPNPSAQTYQGPSAGSEPEVQALVKAFNATPNKIGAIDFHSFSEAILRPYGYQDELAPDEDALLSMSQKMVEAIASVQGTKYTSMTKLYPVTGASRDWFYDNGKVYSYTIELSPDADDEKYEFQLPPQEIKRVGKELWNGVLVFAETLLALPKPKVASQ
jgi:murein tripeptide amidase MpaA